MVEKRRSVYVLVLSGFIIVFAIFLSRYFSSLESISGYLQETGVPIPLMIAGFYVVATVLLLPVSVLSLAAGIFLPFWPALLSVTIGSLVGAATSFLLARYVMGERIKILLSRYDNPLTRFEGKLEKKALQSTFLLRLIPLISYGGLSYSLGLSSIGFLAYMFGTFLATLPGNAILAYFGYSFANLDLSGIILALGLYGVVSFAVYFISRAGTKV